MAGINHMDDREYSSGIKFRNNMNPERENLIEQMTEMQSELTQLKAENERLKQDIEELKLENKGLYECITELNSNH
jgi:peptidoglycan hydrolase CwlO-like protein